MVVTAIALMSEHHVTKIVPFKLNQLDSSSGLLNWPERIVYAKRTYEFHKETNSQRAIYKMLERDKIEAEIIASTTKEQLLERNQMLMDEIHRLRNAKKEETQRPDK